MAFDFPTSPTVGQVYQSYTWDGEKWYSTLGGIPYVNPAPIVSAFLARTSGLDTAHTNAITALITGLVADNLWSKFDVLYIMATQGSANALLNLVSTSYNATAVGSPGFTLDRGYQGNNGGTSPYIDTGFNPTTAVSPKYTLNSAHMAAWNTTGGFTTTQFSAGGSTTSPLTYAILSFFDFGPLASIGAINDAAGLAPSTGHWTGLLHINRSGTNTRVLYKNGAVFGSDSQVSVAVPNITFYTLGSNNNGTPSSSGHFHGHFSVGSSLTATESVNYYNRLRTYMTAVGAP